MNCIFCEIANKNIPSNFLYEDNKVMAIMDIEPICDGHVLIIPKNHIETVFDADKELINHMYKVAEKLTPVLMKVTGEKGITISINYGDKQSIKHLHMHLLPNFRKEAVKDYKEIYKLIKDNIENE